MDHTRNDLKVALDDMMAIRGELGSAKSLLSEAHGYAESLRQDVLELFIAHSKVRFGVLSLALAVTLMMAGMWGVIPDGFPRLYHAAAFSVAALANVIVVMLRFELRMAMWAASLTMGVCGGRSLVLIFGLGERGPGITVYSVMVLVLFVVVAWHLVQDMMTINFMERLHRGSTESG